MANIHQLKVEFDVVEPRPQFGRLMVALDGTKIDLTNSSNMARPCYFDYDACSASGNCRVEYNLQRIVRKIPKDRLHANHCRKLEADAD
jgi:hypothetical protein